MLLRFNANLIRSATFTRYLVWYGALFYTMLSIFQAEERILNTDCSHYFFHLVNGKTFFFPENRIGVWLSQIPVILGAKAGLGLQMLLYLYSLTFPLFYLALSWICIRVYKNPPAALLIWLSLSVGVAYSFYHPVTETHQMLALSAVFWASVTYNSEHKSNGFLNVLTFVWLLWILLCHPLGALVSGGIILLALVKKFLRPKQVLFHAGFIFTSLAVRLAFAQEGSYDQAQYEELYQAPALISQFFSLFPVTYLKDRLWNLYLPVILLIMATGVGAWKKKTLRFWAGAMFCMLGLCLLSIITFHKGDAEMMMEKSFTPALFFLLLTAIEWLRAEKQYLFPLHLGLMALGLFSVVVVVRVGKRYQDRLLKLNHFVQNQLPEHPKWVAHFNDTGQEVLRFNAYATSIDALIYSLIHHQKAKTVFLSNDLSEAVELMPESERYFYMASFWMRFEQKDIDAHYFPLPPVKYQLYPPKPTDEPSSEN